MIGINLFEYDLLSCKFCNCNDGTTGIDIFSFFVCVTNGTKAWGTLDCSPLGGTIGNVVPFEFEFEFEYPEFKAEEIIIVLVFSDDFTKSFFIDGSSKLKK